MKKKRFMKLLALASCVTLLTGCESEAFFGLGKYVNKVGDSFNGILEKLGLKDPEKKEEKQSEEGQQSGEQGGEEQQGGGEEEQKTPTMVVAELPEKLEVGEALDLGEYVTLTNLDDFTVELAANSASLAGVEGHVLTAKGEGNISFTIKAGSLSQACSVVGFRTSREALINYFKGVGKQYTVQLYGPQFDDNDQFTGWALEDVLFHNDNYVLSYFGWDEDDQGNPIAGGFLKFGADAEQGYMFELGEENGDEVVVVGNQTSFYYLDNYNPDFGVDFSKAAYQYDEDEKTDLYVITGNDAKWFAQESLFMANGAVGKDSSGNYVYIDRVEFTIYDEADPGDEPELAVDAYAYYTYGGESYISTIATLYTDPNYVGYELLDEFCVPANEPAGVDNWFFMDSLFGGTGAVGLGDFFLSPDSLLLYPKGIISLEYGWYDANGQAIACPSDATTGNLFAYMPVGGKTMFVSETSLWEVEAVYDNEGNFQGYNPLSGKMEVTGEGEGAKTTVYNIYSSNTGFFAEESEDTSAWSNGEFSFAGMHDRKYYGPHAIASAEHKYTTVAGENEGDPDQEVYSYSMFTFHEGKAAKLLEPLIAGDNGLYYLGAILEAYAEVGSDLTPYFDGYLVIDANSGVAYYSISFAWDTNAVWSLSFTSQYNPNVVSLTANWEAYMTANVINAE